MHPRKIENLMRLPAPQRYLYFIECCAENLELWLLFGKEGWATGSDDSGAIVVPIWPEREFAELCSGNLWKDVVPRKLELDDFVDRWVPGMIKDGRLVGVFPTLSEKAIIMDPAQVGRDLQQRADEF